MRRQVEGAAQATAISRRFKAVLSGEMPAGRDFLLEIGKPPSVVQFAYASDMLIQAATDRRW
jgi:hypothetical protein